MAVALGAIGILSAAVLIAARQPSTSGEVAAADVAVADHTQPEREALESADPREAADARPSVAPSAKVAALAPVARSASNSPASPTANAAMSAVNPSVKPSATADPAHLNPPVKAAAKTDAADVNAPSKSVVSTDLSTTNASAHAAAPASTRSADGSQITTVTITGCLQLDDATFWLKDTSGTDAPKSRSWRSGFLRKHQAPIALVAGTSELDPHRYVGQRVAATGVLNGREMEARSLQPSGTSCK